MFEADPFELFRERRQIELLEARFRARAADRRRALQELIRAPSGREDLARAVEQELQAHYTESRRHVKRLAQAGLHPEAASLEEKLQAEMADFFRNATRAARELVLELQRGDGPPPEATERVAETLDRIFAASLDRVQVAETQLTRARVVPFPELVQRLNTGEDACRPDAAPDPPAPPAQRQPNPTPPAPPSNPPAPRQIRRQAHIPRAPRRVQPLTAREAAELRALKELLLEKGIITAEELAARLGPRQA